MKKRNMAAAALAAAMVCGVFTGCGNGKDIGRDAALDVALNDAGVMESEATRVKVSQDRDDGRMVYEIQFDAQGREYDYEVRASDGAIMSSDIENIENYDQYQGNNTQNNGSAQNGTGQNGNAVQGTDQNQGQGSVQTQPGAQGQNNGNAGAASSVALSTDDAMRIALERVPGATAQDTRIKLDLDDGRYKYEGEIIYNNIEYDFEIDANSGTILEWSEERY